MAQSEHLKMTLVGRGDIARVQRSWWQNNRSVGNESTHAMLKQGMRLTGK